MLSGVAAGKKTPNAICPVSVTAPPLSIIPNPPESSPGSTLSLPSPSQSMENAIALFGNHGDVAAPNYFKLSVMSAFYANAGFL